MENILICGASSFVAKGFKDLLLLKDVQVDSFGRKDGCYLDIDKSNMLSAEYSVVVNFAVLKDQSVEENILYIKALIKMCSEHGVKKLIHFSTIMNYAYNERIVTENTPIESLSETSKKGYAEIKIAVDEYLISVKELLPFELVIVRPGYVLAEDRACPFIKKLPFGFSIIKGNEHSKQPIVRREDIHEALWKIINTECNLSVYHFFPNNGMTKYRYAKETVGGIILTMPKWMFKGIPYLMCKVGLMPKALYSRFEGMYIESDFSSKLTEKKLNYKFS